MATALYLGVDRNSQGVRVAGTAAVASGTTDTGKEIQIVVADISKSRRHDVIEGVTRILNWLMSMDDTTLLS